MSELKENELVTIVVPVYNVEPYLRRCLDSIIGQTYENIEIILVNDGSTDDSWYICDQYSKLDDRMFVYSRKNQGQGAARNFGVLKAEGNYVAFIDSDDVIEKNYVEQLYCTLKRYNADIACCEYKRLVRREKTSCTDDKNKVSKYTNKEALEMLLYQKGMTNSPWCKLIKKDIAKKYPFPENIGYEDMAVVYKWFADAQIVVCSQQKLYYYRQLKTSTMHQPFNEKKLDRIKIAEDMGEYLGRRYPDLHGAIQARFFLANIQTLMWLPFRRKYRDEFSKIKKNIKRVRRIVLCDKNAKISHRLIALTSYFEFAILIILGKIYRAIIV